DGEPERRFGLVHFHFEDFLGSDDERGIPISERLQPTFDFLEACLPLLQVRQGLIEQCFGIPLARRDVDLGEAKFREDTKDLIRRGFWREHRTNPGAWKTSVGTPSKSDSETSFAM